MATVGARLRGGKPAVNLADLFALFLGNVLQNLDEGSEAEITYFPSPKLFHRSDVELLNTNNVVSGEEPAGELEVEVFPLVVNLAVLPRQPTLRLLPIVRAALLARKLFMKVLDLFQAFLERLWSLNPISVGSHQEILESEVEPDSITCSWQFRGRWFFLDRETDPEIPAGISLDRDGLDLALDRARLDEFVVVVLDANSVSTEELPTGLRERKRGVFLALLEPRTPGRIDLEEPLVRLIQALNHVLEGLRVEVVPVALVPLLQLREVLLERVVAGILAVNFVVPASESHKVVPHHRRKLDAFYEVFVALAGVKPVLVRLAHGLRLILDVPPDDLLAHFAGRAHEIRAGPKRRKPVKLVELFSQNVSAFFLESMNYLIGCVAGIRLNEQVNMIGTNCQRADLPVMLIRYVKEYLFKTIGNLILQHLRPTLQAPHEVVLHRVDGVTRPLVWFFVDWHHSINRPSQPVFWRKSLP